MGKLHLRTEKDDKEYDVTIEEDEGSFNMPSFAKDDWIVVSQFFEERTTRNTVFYSLKKEAPKSCIESAEFVLQTFHGRTPPDWAPDQDSKPRIYAHFGDGGVINITESENVVDELTGKKELPFPQRDGGGYEAFTLGVGLIIGNVSEDDDNEEVCYNMHLGAMVAMHVKCKAAIISDVSEDGDVKLVKPWRVVGIMNPDDFRGETYKNKDIYKIGLLLPTDKLPQSR